jgi:hypothetical protein
MEISRQGVIEYVHRETGEEVETAAWCYRLIEEIRLPASFGEVLCVFAFSNAGSACCGAGEVRYIMVPGRIISWRSGKTAGGRISSRVKGLIDEVEMDEVRSALAERFPCCQVCF